MGAGIRALLEFDRADICPISRVSNETGTRIEAVDRNVTTDGSGVIASEFVVDEEGLETDGSAVIEGTIIPVYSHGPYHRYRLIHESDNECPCECIGSMGCPVSTYAAANGTITVEFHATDFEELQQIIGTLRDSFPGINIRRLIRDPGTDRVDDVVLVDRSSLTRRQLEVLRTAYEMGYFESPREANVAEIADALEIHPSTVNEHLTIAHRKLLEQVF